MSNQIAEFEANLKGVTLKTSSCDKTALSANRKSSFQHHVSRNHCLGR